jgi:sulfur-oxidizing protein SoxB
MTISRREFMRLMGLAGAAGMLPSSVFAQARQPSDLYEVPKFGNVTLLHITDTHAQLNPIYFREPNVNIGIGPAFGKAPHLVGEALLKHFGIQPGGIEAHAFRYLNYPEAAEKFGAVGGFAHLKTLVDRIRAERGDGNSLLMDGGDTWQGSGTAYWTRGMDMVGACNRLGVDVMTGHWEFTYLDEEVIKNIGPSTATSSRRTSRCAKRPCSTIVPRLRRLRRGRRAGLQALHHQGGRRRQGGRDRPGLPLYPHRQPAALHPGLDLRHPGFAHAGDRRSGARRGVAGPGRRHLPQRHGRGPEDGLQGHRHRRHLRRPHPRRHAGADHCRQRLRQDPGHQRRLQRQVPRRHGPGREGRQAARLPLSSAAGVLEPAAGRRGHGQVHRGGARPYQDKLTEELATAEELLYRRGNFNGTFDQVICDALRKVNDAQISLSPGFRWGTTVLPGQKITMDNVMDQTCITYPETYRREMTGAEIKAILEDVCDNLFNVDPYVQQGGDMVRVGGLDYVCDPAAGMNERITDMQLDDGTKIEADKSYVVAGWATVGSQSPGEPIWETVATYLRDVKTVKLEKLNTPKLKGVDGNPGLSDYAGELLS